MPHLVTAVVLEVCTHGKKVFWKTLVVCRTRDEGDMVFGNVRSRGARRVEKTGAYAMAESVETPLFEGHVA
jgi:hypothetical protein